MRKQNRRTFLQQTGAGLAGAAALGWAPSALGRSSSSSNPRALPPHRSLELTGVHAYADQESVAAGGRIDFQVSATVPYRLSICRLGLAIDDPAGDEVLHSFPESPAHSQPIHPGSYVQITRHVPRVRHGLTLECWVRPWRFGTVQGVISQQNAAQPADFSLSISPEAGVSFYTGDGTTHRSDWVLSTPGGQLRRGHWHHIVATWDGHARLIWIDGVAVSRTDSGPDLAAIKWTCPLRVGAGAANERADQMLDGDVAMPVIYERALTPVEIRDRFEARGLVAPRGSGIVAYWPLEEERGETIRDRSGKRRHGQLINHGTWMIGGPSFRAEVTRFGDYRPDRDPQRGHGLRLAADDLYDCRWASTQSWTVPADARPGLHVARLRFELNGKPHLYDVTFIVRRAPRARKAPLLVLCASNTWRAYSGTPFAANQPNHRQVWGTGGGPELPNKPPAFNFYRAHAAGQGTYQMGLRMPWPVAGPYIRYGDRTDYSHLMRAERFFHAWLEEMGYEFDVIADADLHRQPGLLREYRAFVINGHSEYWSLEMLRGLEKYLGQGGHVVVLSGNSLFWRVTYSDDGLILECRKVDAPGEQVPGARRGEAWHSQDGARGGMLRECGFPGWKLIGLESLGWNNQGNPENFGPYVAELTDHFLFNQPERTGLKTGDRFGWGGEGKMPMANGHEFDVRLSTLAGLQEKPNPPGASVPKDPPGMTRIANGIIPWKKGGAPFDYFFRPIQPKTDQGGEMIYWERTDGGKVFNAGSIGAGWAIHADPKFQILMRNVLHHFGVQRIKRWRK
jgi:N,N-dimethylformamidase